MMGINTLSANVFRTMPPGILNLVMQITIVVTVLRRDDSEVWTQPMMGIDTSDANVIMTMTPETLNLTIYTLDFVSSRRRS